MPITTARTARSRRLIEVLDNADRIRGLYEAAARGDFAAWVEAFHEGIEWRTADNVTYFGPQAVVAGITSRIHEFDAFAIDIRRIIAAGDIVVAEARYRAVAKATGKVLDAQGVHVFDLRDGKIVRVQQYTDTWQFAEVKGTMPAASTAGR
jgi:ketosteroid isomerase-like protein